MLADVNLGSLGTGNIYETEISKIASVHKEQRTKGSIPTLRTRVEKELG